MRHCLLLLALAAYPAWTAGSAPSQTLRGTLRVEAGKPPSLIQPDHSIVTLEGDDATEKVLADPRTSGFAIEAHGHFVAPARFLIDPIHTHSVLVRSEGKLKLITYFCDVCNIRTYIPGPCVCCQKETTLELVDPGSN